MAKLDEQYEYMGPLDNAGGQGEYEYVGPLSGGAMDYVTEPVTRSIKALASIPKAAMDAGEQAVTQWGQDRQNVLTSPPNPLKHFPAVGKFIAQSAPEIAGGVAGGALAQLLGPGWATVPGAAAGSGAARALYEWLTGTPGKEAIIQGETSALMGAATPRIPFKGGMKVDPVKAAAYEGTGVKPTLGDLTKNRLAQGAEAISGRSLIGSGGTQKFQQGQLDVAGQRFKDVMEGLGGVRERFPLWEETKQAVERRLEKFKQVYEQAKGKAFEAVGDQPIIGREAAIAKAQDLIEQIDKANPALRGELQTIRQRLKEFSKTKQEAVMEDSPLVDPTTNKPFQKVVTPEKDLSKETIQEWDINKTLLGKLGRSKQITAPIEKGYYEGLYGPQAQAVEQVFLEAGLDPKTASHLGKFYKQSVIDLEDTMPGKLVKEQMNREQVGGMFTKEGLTPLMDLKKWAPGKFHEVRNRGFIDHLERLGAVDWERSTFDPGKFKNAWFGIKDDVKRYAFEPQTIAKFDQLASVAEDLARKGIAPGRTPGMGSNLPLWQVLSALGGGGIAGYLNNPLAALPGLAFLGLPGLAGKAVRSPSVIRGMTTPYSPAQKIGRASGFAALGRQGEDND